MAARDKGSILAAALVITMVSQPVRAQKDDNPTILTPSTTWNLNYAEDRCRLGRIFGDGNDATVFWIEQVGPSSTFSWLVAGGAVRRLGSTRGVKVAFGPGFEAYDVEAFTPPPLEKQTIHLGRYGQAMQSSGYREPSPGEPAQTITARDTASAYKLDVADGERIEYVEFTRKHRVVRLPTGRMADAFAALNACTSNLYASWGVDPAEMARVVKSAELSNLQDVARRIQRHYPTRAAFSGEDAVMTLKVLVGRDGRVEKCITIEQTDAAKFDERACELFEEYADFEPARDSEGQNTRDFFSTTVVYATR